jgi:hypothetical protein
MDLRIAGAQLLDLEHNQNPLKILQNLTGIGDNNLWVREV